MKILGWNSNSSCLHLEREVAQVGKRLSKKTPGRVLLSRAARYIRKGEYAAAIEDLDKFELVAKGLKSDERANIQSMKSELRRGSKFNLSKLIQESLSRFTLNQIYLRLVHWITSIPQISENLSETFTRNEVTRANSCYNWFRVGSAQKFSWCSTSVISC